MFVMQHRPDSHVGSLTMSKQADEKVLRHSPVPRMEEHAAPSGAGGAGEVIQQYSPEEQSGLFAVVAQAELNVLLQTPVPLEAEHTCANATGGFAKKTDGRRNKKEKTMRLNNCSVYLTLPKPVDLLRNIGSYEID